MYRLRERGCGRGCRQVRAKEAGCGRRGFDESGLREKVLNRSELSKTHFLVTRYTNNSIYK